MQQVEATNESRIDKCITSYVLVVETLINLIGVVFTYHKTRQVGRQLEKHERTGDEEREQGQSEENGNMQPQTE